MARRLSSDKSAPSCGTIKPIQTCCDRLTGPCMGSMAVLPMGSNGFRRTLGYPCADADADAAHSTRCMTDRSHEPHRSAVTFGSLQSSTHSSCTAAHVDTRAVWHCVCADRCCTRKESACMCHQAAAAPHFRHQQLSWIQECTSAVLGVSWLDVLSFGKQHITLAVPGTPHRQAACVVNQQAVLQQPAQPAQPSTQLHQPEMPVTATPSGPCQQNQSGNFPAWIASRINLS
jgi:hypothetical protein